MANPIGRFGEFHSYPPLQAEVAAGDDAGNIAVNGIKTTDTLMLVINVAAAGINLASEFTIAENGIINNTGGTDTTGMTLLVLWYSAQVGLAGI